MADDLAQAKEVVLLALERGGSIEDHGLGHGTLFRREGFTRIVRTIEDREPAWLEQHLRDPAYDRMTRTQIAHYLTGPDADVLLLELMAD